jgi:hypothetical protein
MSVGVNDPLVVQAAQALHLSPQIVAAQINEESGGNPTARSPAGALGEFQFLPSTYTGLGFPAGTETNPKEEVLAYIKYMGQLLAQEHGNVRNALAAYNAGPGNLSAGYGYADTILNNAGAGTGTTVSTAGGASPSAQTSSGGGSWLSDIAGFLGLGQATTAATDLTGTLDDFLKISGFLVNPASWVRIGAFLLAVILLAFGIYILATANHEGPVISTPKTLPIPVPV